jgi:hypothetical protein
MYLHKEVGWVDTWGLQSCQLAVQLLHSTLLWHALQPQQAAGCKNQAASACAASLVLRVRSPTLSCAGQDRTAMQRHLKAGQQCRGKPAAGKPEL